MQVFGGIAFTEEHPAHRFLRRIIAREQQFGDAAHHERELGRCLAASAAPGGRGADAAPPAVERVTERGAV
jgi:alkylation response protein AidB-like acyl-CoA dehydrogenase